MIFVTPADNLQAVFDEAPEQAEIHLAPGIYRQKAVIRRPGLTVVGADAGKTVIVWDDHARKRDFLGAEFNTFRTYTLAVCADGVTIRNLTVANDALHPEIKGQEVALSVVADGFFMEDCTLTSTQDTLFLGPLPSDLIGRYEGFLNDELRRGGRLTQSFRSCLIEGTVDFIFGRGCADFEHCQIRSLSDARRIGFVAAPAHEKHQREGFTFRHCSFTCEEAVPSGSVFLARPWRDYGMASFEACAYGRHIAPEGFDKWSGTHRDETARFSELPAVPGRVPWLGRQEACP